MDLKDYVGALRQRWYLLVACVILGAVIGYGYGALQDPQYRASASAFVSSQRGETVTELIQGSQYTQSQMQSYANLALTPAVLDPVIDELGLDTTPDLLARSIESEVELNTVIVRISVTDTDPEKAAAVANAVVDSLGDAVGQLAPSNSDGDPSVALTTISPAAVPEAPFAPSKSLLLATGAMIGLILAALYAVLKSAFDTRVRDESDLERVADLPFLGSSPRRPKAKRGTHGSPAAVEWDNSASTREAYRRIATNLDFADLDGDLGVVVVTSALPGDGKTTTSAFLGLALAERGHRVLVIDCDLRHPRLAEVYGVAAEVGLTSVLRQQIGLADAVQPLAGRSVDVLASGTRAPNPAEIVNSQALRTLLAESREHYDFVVIDSAPVLAVSDTLTIARLIGSTIVVTRYNSTRRQSISRAMDELLATGSRVHGVVLNGVPSSRHALGYYGEDRVVTVTELDAPVAPSERPGTADADELDDLAVDDLEEDLDDALDDELGTESADDDGRARR